MYVSLCTSLNKCFLRSSKRLFRKYPFPSSQSTLRNTQRTKRVYDSRTKIFAGRRGILTRSGCQILPISRSVGRRVLPLFPITESRHLDVDDDKRWTQMFFLQVAEAPYALRSSTRLNSIPNFLVFRSYSPGYKHRR